MPHVSKEKLDQELYQKLFTQMTELSSDLSRKQAGLMFNSLLTETEKTMLTKRFAAAVMFEKGYSNYRVWNTLKVSPSTASRLRHQYDQGVFDGVLYILRSKAVSKKEKEEFMSTLNKILRLGMPSMGKGRWESLPK